MTSDLPTPSITGHQGWHWNRWQAEHDDPGGSDDARPSGRAEQDRQRSEPNDLAALRREVRTLRLKLERTEQRKQYLIEHYEGLLAERGRNRRAEPSQQTWRDSLVAALTGNR